MSLDSFLNEKTTATNREIAITSIVTVIFGMAVGYAMGLSSAQTLPPPPAGVDKPAPQVIIIRPDQGPHNPFKDETQNGR